MDGIFIVFIVDALLFIAVIILMCYKLIISPEPENDQLTP